MDEGQLILTEKLEEVMGIMQGIIEVVKHQEKMIQQINSRVFADEGELSKFHRLRGRAQGIGTEFHRFTRGEPQEVRPQGIGTEFRQDSLEDLEELGELGELMMEMNVS